MIEPKLFYLLKHQPFLRLKFNSFQVSIVEAWRSTAQRPNGSVVWHLLLKVLV